MQQQQQQQVEQEQQQQVVRVQRERQIDKKGFVCIFFFSFSFLFCINKTKAFLVPKKKQNQIPKKRRENKKCIRKFIHKTSENNNSSNSRYTVIDMKIHSYTPLSVSLSYLPMSLLFPSPSRCLCLWKFFIYYILCTVVGLLPHAKNFTPSPALVFTLLLCHKMHSGREQYIYFFWGLSLVRRLSKRGKYV